MKLETLRFGEMEIDEQQIVRFPEGIPGFELLQRYVWVTLGEEVPFAVMQSIDDGEISFIVTNPFLYHPEYEFDLPASDQDDLQVDETAKVEIWSIVSVGDDLQEATVNLKAPVVVNRKDNVGKQVILHDYPYQTKQRLLPSEQNQTQGKGR